MQSKLLIFLAQVIRDSHSLKFFFNSAERTYIKLKSTLVEQIVLRKLSLGRFRLCFAV